MNEHPILSQKQLRLLLLAPLLLQPVCGFADTGRNASFANLTLEQLMNVSVEVTSAAKKPQKLEDTAAAVYVITREDIRMSGMTSLPELLRMAPGMQVARIDGSTWAIGSRGWNAKNSDNLLVMLDGRVLQTPTFTGVNWDAQDVALQDVERIEVTRGSGGSLWGANAVTGVINIITRSAAQTQGGMVNAGGGNYERQGTARYGGRIGEDGHFRVYARSVKQDAFTSTTGAQGYDQRDLQSAGFRADWALAGGDSLTVQGDAYSGGSDHTGTAVSLTAPSTPIDYTIDLGGGNVLARWKRALSATSEWAVQVYYDFYDRRYFNLNERRDTYDLDFQHRFQWGKRHDIVWGAGYRRTSDDMENTFTVSFNPAQRTDEVFSAFFQDEIALKQDSLYLIAGSKFEHNNYTGYEVQPNLRLRWKIDGQRTAWAAVSRAVHTPSRTDTDGQVTAARLNAFPTFLQLQGNPNAESERVLSYEAGYRVNFSERAQTDIAAFYSQHHHLSTIETGTIYSAGSYNILPLVFDNKASANTYGVEWSGSWQPADKWRVKAAYSWLKMDIRREPGSNDTSIEKEETRSAQNLFQLHAFHALNAQNDLSASLYYTDSLASLGVRAYTRVDARWGWRPQRDLELSLTARNLLDPKHPEFVNTAGPRTTEIPRSLFGAVTWKF